MTWHQNAPSHRWHPPKGIEIPIVVFLLFEILKSEIIMFRAKCDKNAPSHQRDYSKCIEIPCFLFWIIKIENMNISCEVWQKCSVTLMAPSEMYWNWQKCSVTPMAPSEKYWNSCSVFKFFEILKSKIWIFRLTCDKNAPSCQREYSKSIEIPAFLIFLKY